MNIILIAGILGALGALFKVLLEQNGRVALPTLEYGINGEVYVHLGVVANLLVGAIAAEYTASVSASVIPLYALFIVGIAATFVGEALIEQIKKNPWEFITKRRQ